MTTPTPTPHRDESIPHLKSIDKAITKLHDDIARLKEEVAGQTKTLVSATEHVVDSITDQTTTLAEMEIITRIAELEAMKALVTEEERRLVEEGGQDDEDLRELERSFKESIEEIGNLRDERIRRLAEPAFLLLEEDLERKIEPRVYELNETLDSCFEALTDTVHQREDVLRAAIEDARSAVEEFIEHRRFVREQIAQLQVDPDVLPSSPEGIEYGVPVYIVEFEDSSGVEEHEIYVPLPTDKEELTEVSSALKKLIGPSVSRILAGLGKRRSFSLTEDQLAGELDQPPGGGFVWNSLLKGLAERQVSFYSDASEPGRAPVREIDGTHDPAKQIPVDPPTAELTKPTSVAPSPASSNPASAGTDKPVADTEFAPSCGGTAEAGANGVPSETPDHTESLPAKPSTGDSQPASTPTDPTEESPSSESTVSVSPSAAQTQPAPIEENVVGPRPTSNELPPPVLPPIDDDQDLVASESETLGDDANNVSGEAAPTEDEPPAEEPSPSPVEPLSPAQEHLSEATELAKQGRFREAVVLLEGLMTDGHVEEDILTLRELCLEELENELDEGEPVADSTATQEDSSEETPTPVEKPTADKGQFQEAVALAQRGDMREAMVILETLISEGNADERVMELRSLCLLELEEEMDQRGGGDQ